MKSPVLIHAGLAFLNLVGLGAGYLFLKAWKRWIPAFVIAVALLVAAVITDLLIFLIALAIWLLLLAADGYLQASKLVFEEGRLAKWPWLPIPIGLLLIGLYAVVASLYINGAQTAFEKGNARYLAADCPGAVENFERVTGFYRLANAINNSRAADRSEECGYFVFGDESLEAGEYADAIAAFDTYLSLYPGSPITQQTIDKGAETYLLWAADLRQADEYEQALDKYTELAVKYPHASQILDVPAATTAANVEWGDYYHQNEDFENAIKQYLLVLLGPDELTDAFDLNSRLAAAYFDWAVSQRDAAEFETAIQNYQVVVDEYPDTDSGDPAVEAIPNTYYEWAQSLIEGGEVQQAIDLYDLLIEQYPGTEAAQQADAGRAEAYLGLAQALFEDGDFNEAIETYLFVQELTEDQELQGRAEAGIEETITGLSLDTGKEGQQVLEDILELACDHRPAEFSLANNVPEERGKFLACPNSPSGFYIPDTLQAKYPAELRYAVLVSINTVNLDFARYGPRGEFRLYRQRVDWVVTVINVTTGQTVASKTFTGGEPDNFPPSWRFGSNPDYMQGPPPAMSEISDWLVTIY